MHGGFEVWLLNRCGLTTCHLTFIVEIRHRFALGDMDCDNHTGRGKHVYIYIHHDQCKHTEQESKSLHP